LLRLLKKGTAVEDAGQWIDPGQADQLALQTMQALGGAQSRI
jgi:hypothetical protein